MNTSQNIAYRSIGTILTVGLLSSAYASVSNNNNFIPISSYSPTVNYTTQKQTTVDRLTIQNDIGMLRKLEIASFNETIHAKFETTITQTWIPADTFLEKSCLLVQVKNQEVLMKQYNDFELELYLVLEKKIAKSHFFDMIALM